MNQTEQIKKHLESGKPITPLQALNKFGCLRLSARIFQLRQDGYKIDTIPTKKNGKVFASYKLN